MSERVSFTLHRVRLASKDLRDWESFYKACQSKFAFGEGRGLNKDAWVECMEELGDSNTAFPTDGLILIEYSGKFYDRQVNEDIVRFLAAGIAAANGSIVAKGKRPQLMLADVEPT